jgi:FKBP-type peptidyl-prolyl cis-trans isomerase
MREVEENVMRLLATLAAVAAMASCSEAQDSGAAAGTAAEAPAPATGAVSDSPVENLAAAEAYLAQNGAREGVTTTASGLQYEVLASGPADGTSPAPGQYVCVHYRGALLDGTEFDSSYSRNAASAFESDRLIDGWVEALAMMKPGDAWRLTIPPELAYGERGFANSIPPNAALVFDMELIKLLDGPPPAGTNCAE